MELSGPENPKNLKKYGGERAEWEWERERSGERAESAAHDPLEPNID